MFKTKKWPLYREIKMGGLRLTELSFSYFLLTRLLPRVSAYKSGVDTFKLKNDFFTEEEIWGGEGY